MAQHYTGNTVSVAKWCHKCQRQTQHRVDDHRVTRVCMECDEAPVPSPLGTIVEVPQGCSCPKYPGSHFHAIRGHDGDLYRFKPGTWEENRKA